MNISLSRIWAIVLRHTYLQFRELYRLSEIIYWPIFDITLWGFAAVWAQQNSNALIVQQIIVGMCLWQFYYRNNGEIGGGVLEEIWERNFLNLFSTPLKLAEWAIGLIIVALIRSTISFITCALFAWLVFKVNIFFAPGYLFLWLINLAIFGWIGGLVTTLFLLSFGRQTTPLIWMNAWVWAIFSGALFPVDVLPWWLQKLAWCFPITYIFFDIRNTLLSSPASWHPIIISFMLNIFYGAVIFLLLKKVFENARRKGLSRLT